MGAALNSSPHVAGEADDAGTHNNKINPLIDAINTHTHDPADLTHGYGGPVNPASGAIPADVTEAVIDPAPSGSLTSISANQGIRIEIMRLRGAMQKLTGSQWYNATGTVVKYTGATSNISITGTMTATTFASSATTGAPFSVASTNLATNKVVNLNSDALDGAQGINTASTSSPASFVNSIAIHDNNGYLPISLVGYDAIEAATFDTLAVSGINTNFNRIRYIIQKIAQASGNGSTWTDYPTSLVASLGIFGSSNRGGQTYLYSGTGILISEPNPGVFRIDSTGVAAPISGGLNYYDVLADSIVTGLSVTSGGGLNAVVNPGTAYVNQVRQQLIYPQTIVLNDNATNYIYWDGGPTTSDFIVNTTGVQPVGTIVLASAITASGSITSINDKRVIGLYANSHVSVAGPVPSIVQTSGAHVSGITITGNDVKGTIGFTGTATSNTNATGQVSITFANPYPTNPAIIIKMQGTVTITINPIKTVDSHGMTTGFSLWTSTAPVNGTTYTVDYIVLG